MSGAVLDGKKISQEILGELQPRIEILRAKARPPALAVVLVGEDPASQIYVQNKMKKRHSPQKEAAERPETACFARGRNLSTRLQHVTDAPARERPRKILRPK